ncbi:nitrate- and nitrite sensing domain-containing protein [Streptomyces sp. BI20]|uniref:sensor histidine kinase n=1 Tax=Streptomyces sp. BI20 TaxID=3403460 RepID=UPI003C76506C
MRFRGKSIRRKIVALLLVPLVSLTAMWGFTTVLTGRQALDLLDVDPIIHRVGYPMEFAVGALQTERRQTLVYLGDPRDIAATEALKESRAAADEKMRAIGAAAADPELREDLDPSSVTRLDAIAHAFAAIADLRGEVDRGRLKSAAALDRYNRLVDPGHDFLSNLHTLQDVEMDKEGRALVGVTRAREMFSRQDAVVAGALAAGRITAAELRSVTELTATRRLLYDVNLAVLPETDRTLFTGYWTGPQSAAVREAEALLAGASAGRTPLGLTADDWNAAADRVMTDTADMGLKAGDRYKDRVMPVARRVLLTAGVAGVLGLGALLLSVALSVRIGRSLVRDLSRLRKEAHEASGVRLPAVMRRLAAGEPVDIETEAPRLEYERDEVGQVGQALNTLQRAAVEAAVKQAELRRGISEVFVNLARRNQVLLHRQLTLLDAMERRTEDTDELADLFRLDHMTTRMRRHAEGLVILSGAAPSRQWRRPVPLMDVVRAAVAEVEDYARVEVRRLPRIGIDGPAVGDVTHLIAELLENATVFSPPHTTVEVHGEEVANGFTLTIHDRGLGMTPEALLDANLRLGETTEFALSDTDRLGLFVAGRLASRRRVRVSLQTSPYGGTTAVVLLPAALLTEVPEGQSGTRAEGDRADRPARLERLDRESRARAGSRPGGRPPAGLGRRPAAPLRGNGSPGRHRAGALLDEGPGPLGYLGLEPAGFEPLPAMASLDDETPPGGTPRSVLLGPLTSPPNRVPRPEPRTPARPEPADEAPGDTPAPARPTGPVRPARPPHADHDAPRPASGAVPLPRRRPAAESLPAPTAGPTASPTASPAPPHAQARPAPGTPAPLPRRVRQTHLAPQLRVDPDAPERTDPAGRSGQAPVADLDAEEVRARMSALQRGWTAGRAAHALEHQDPRHPYQPHHRHPHDDAHEDKGNGR